METSSTCTFCGQAVGLLGARSKQDLKTPGRELHSSGDIPRPVTRRWTAVFAHYWPRETGGSDAFVLFQLGYATLGTEDITPGRSLTILGFISRRYCVRRSIKPQTALRNGWLFVASDLAFEFRSHSSPSNRPWEPSMSWNRST